MKATTRSPDINFVMMQAMPDDIVKDSNGMNRFVGTGKYAKDVDLHSKMMTAYLDELATMHIAVDPTLVTFEDLYVPDRGTYPPSDAPYADTLPSQFARGFLSSAMAPQADLSRADMRASFAKLKDLVAELNKRHIEVLAGTDGVGFELIRELQLYTEAGLSVEDALATATINPATVYGMADKTGSLAKGKLAELALIDGDPSKDITELRQVELVMRDGKLMKASELRAPTGYPAPHAVELERLAAPALWPVLSRSREQQPTYGLGVTCVLPSLSTVVVLSGGGFTMTVFLSVLPHAARSSGTSSTAMRRPAVLILADSVRENARGKRRRTTGKPGAACCCALLNTSRAEVALDNDGGAANSAPTMKRINGPNVSIAAGPHGRMTPQNGGLEITGQRGCWTVGRDARGQRGLQERHAHGCRACMPVAEIT